MKLLLISDEEELAFWDYYRPGRFKDYDLILSAGDLKADYLSFIVTMANRRVLYVHGNHDKSYEQFPPEGCDCIDDDLVVVNGLRILGLGGCMLYSGQGYQYSEREMEKRIRKLRRKIRKAGGVDVVVAHAPIAGLGDGEDLCHRGFEAFKDLLDTYHPALFVHGHVHMRYGNQAVRVQKYGDTTVVNACGHYDIELPDRPQIPQKSGLLTRLRHHFAQ